MKILGIDYNTNITSMLDKVLNAYGFEYSYVNSGKAGLKTIQEEKFDLVLLDPVMPEFSGVDIIDVLARENLLHKQKIILFTSSSITDKEIHQLLERGVHSCIRKPVDIDQLIERLNDIGSS